MDIQPDMISSSFSSSSSIDSIIYDCRAQLMVIVVVAAWKFFNNDNDRLNLCVAELLIFNQKSLKSSTHVVRDGGAKDDDFSSPHSEHWHCWR